MELTARKLNRATLARQLLLERQALPVVEGVRRVVAVQAQEPASPYVARWNRLAGFAPADLDSAFTDQTVVKASLLRLTLHAVAADDHPAFHAAMLTNLRASRLGDQRYTGTGLTVADADEAIGELRTFLAVPRTKDEIEAQLVAGHGPERSSWLWWALRTFAPLLHVPTGPPWSFGRRKSYRAVPSPAAQAPDHEAGVQHLVVRYLEGFGPASAADIGQFTLRQRGKVRTDRGAGSAAHHPHRARREDALRRSRRAVFLRGDAGAAAPARDVGQRRGGLLRPQPRRPGRAPFARHAAQR